MAFHLINTGPEGFPLAIVKQHSYNFELAAMYVLVLGFFTVNGAGPWSVDEQVLGGPSGLTCTTPTPSSNFSGLLITDSSRLELCTGGLR